MNSITPRPYRGPEDLAAILALVKAVRPPARLCDYPPCSGRGIAVARLATGSGNLSMQRAAQAGFIIEAEVVWFQKNAGLIL